MSAEQQAQEQRELSEEVREQRRLIELGFDAEQFMASPIGRYIKQRANTELQEAQDALVEQELQTPEGRARASELQIQARVAARVLTYFGDMVNQGENAQRTFAALYDESGGA